MKRLTALAAASLVLASGVTAAQAADVWFDVNGTLPDSGVASQAYDWFSGQIPPQAMFNADSLGVGTGTAPWVNGDFAHFSAGGDGTGVAFRVNNSNNTAGSVTLSGLQVEEGHLILSGGAITLGANPARIDPGATLEIPGLSNVVTAAGSVLTIDGGTLRNTVQGVGSGQWSSLGTIELTAAGGTFDTPNNPLVVPNAGYSIMVFNNSVTMATGVTAATLTKTGAGEFRGLNNWNFTTLDVQEGLYRINGTGGGETGFGAATGTITTHGGALPDNYVGSALGTSITITSPATRSIVLGTTLGPDTAFVLNALWTINGPISGPGGLMLNGWTRKDTNALIGSAGQVLTLGGTNTYGGNTTINFGTIAAANGSAIPDTSRVVISSNSTYGVTTGVTTATFRADASETIANLEGGGGTPLRGLVNLNGAAVVLTLGGDNGSTTYGGNVSGAGSLTKVGTGTLTIENFDWTNTGGVNINDGEIKFNTAASGFATTAPVAITAPGKLNMNGVNDTFGSLSGNGTVQMDNGGTTAGNLVLAGTAAGPITFSGNISKNAATTGGNLTKSGAGSTHVLSGTNSVSALAVNAGTLLINGTTTASGGATVGAGATLGGTGTVVGALANNGTLAPGASVGTLSVTGNVTNGAGSIWDIELSGTTADLMAVTGNIDLTAPDTLNVLGSGTGTSWLIGTYTGALTGVFDAITSGYTVSYTGGNITLNAAPACAPGDLNCDTHVDAQDYVFWRKNNGTQTDYDLWRANFGVPPGSGSGGGGGGLSGGAVPEPTTIGLVLIGLAALGLGRRTRVA